MNTISLSTNTPEFFNDLCEEIRLFLSADKIAMLPSDMKTNDKGICFVHREEAYEDGNYVSRATILKKGQKKAGYAYFFRIIGNDPLEIKRERKNAGKITLYRLLNRYTGKKMPWGPLTGIRPTKYLRDLETRVGQAVAEEYLIKTLGVSRQKFDLARSIVTRQKSVIQSVGEKAIDIYIGIPFCPSICTYCSFGSKRIKKGDALQERYMDALITEIEALKPAVKGRDIRSVYIGGGTPTSLDLPLLERLLDAVAEWGKDKEFTVEAGRPDTIDAKVLELLSAYGVNRISINPQTFKEETLTKVGRRHSVDEVYTAYKTARKYGFAHINLDLILGLPGETLTDMRRSVKRAIAMAPESITVHTLAIKNASAMNRANTYTADEKMMEKAVEKARQLCEKSGFLPYYMYRQKYMKGNLENVGYAKTDRLSVYNIDMMEEVTDILAFGAGAISKKIYRDQGRHERIPNPKDLETYFGKLEKLIEAKRSAF